MTENKPESIKLRPHHLLSTQGYRGKGYDPAFIRNMDRVTEDLLSDPAVEIELVFGTDDICAACPNRQHDTACISDDKVLRYDHMTVTLFDLEEKRYRYRELIQMIDEKMTESMLESICGDCEWYANSACRKSILK